MEPSRCMTTEQRSLCTTWLPLRSCEKALNSGGS
jgi:hypothetical protein